MFDPGYSDWESPGFDGPGRSVPSFAEFGSLFRRSDPNAGSLAPALTSIKSDQLAATAQMSGAPRVAGGFRGLSRLMGPVGGVITGAQTYNSNPANLTPMGAMIHGGMTGVASAFTPPPLALADAASGGYGANAIEDMSGAMLKPFFGKPSQAEERQ